MVCLFLVWFPALKILSAFRTMITQAFNKHIGLYICVHVIRSFKALIQMCTQAACRQTIPHRHTAEYRGIAGGEEAVGPPAQSSVWYLRAQAALWVMRAMGVGVGQSSKAATGNYMSLLQAHRRGQSDRKHLLSQVKNSWDVCRYLWKRFFPGLSLAAACGYS